MGILEVLPPHARTGLPVEPQAGLAGILCDAVESAPAHTQAFACAGKATTGGASEA
jgi:hypothetical protein